MKSLLSAVALTAAMMTHAWAQSACGPYDVIARALTDRYSEERVGHDQAFELWASENGSWTFLRREGAIACVIGAGQNWQSADIPAGIPI
jgi:hypothetical protein